MASDRQETLLQRLRDGTIPLRAEADELNVLAPGVTVLTFSPSGIEDLMYFTAAQLGPSINPDPGPGPFLPGEEFDLFFVYDRAADEPTVFDDFVPGSVSRHLRGCHRRRARRELLTPTGKVSTADACPDP